MRIYYKLLIICAIYFLPYAVYALEMKSLYRAEVPVTSQQATARTEGLKDALQSVLIKVSGNNQISDNPAIQEKLDEAISLVNEYGYKTSSTASGSELYLWVSFDPEGVKALLQTAGVPLWGEDRPLIVPWFVSELPGETTHILTEEQDPMFVTAFKQAAKQRGLPVIFPLMDLKDLAEVGPESILTDNNAVLLQAAKRYGSNAILMGQIVAVSNGMRMTATLWLAGEHWHWELEGKDSEALSQALTDRVAGILSAHSAALAAEEEQTEVHLTVEGIRGAEDVTALTGYLQHLTSVVGVDVQQVLGSSVVLELELRGGMAAFTREIAAGARLVPVSQSLNYQWKG